jgi:hypothetical protein
VGFTLAVKSMPSSTPAMLGPIDKPAAARMAEGSQEAFL